MTLLPHPILAPSLAVGVTARVGWTRDTLRIEYTLSGAVGDVVWPSRAPAAFADRLWESTCFEVFIAIAGGSGYLEVNAAPSTAWAAYDFEGYRMKSRDLRDAVVSVDSSQPPSGGNGVVLDVNLSSTGRFFAGSELELGISAVLEDVRGERHYYALAHPAERPDFHDRRGFLLSLPVPGGIGP